MCCAGMQLVLGESSTPQQLGPLPAQPGMDVEQGGQDLGVRKGKRLEALGRELERVGCRPHVPQGPVQALKVPEPADPPLSTVRCLPGTVCAGVRSRS